MNGKLTNYRAGAVDVQSNVRVCSCLISGVAGSKLMFVSIVCCFVLCGVIIAR
jgi:hypothetical protein